jgi:hypothetical protein
VLSEFNPASVTSIPVHADPDPDDHANSTTTLSVPAILARPFVPLALALALFTIASDLAVSASSFALALEVVQRVVQVGR